MNESTNTNSSLYVAFPITNGDLTDAWGSDPSLTTEQNKYIQEKIIPDEEDSYLNSRYRRIEYPPELVNSCQESITRNISYTKI